MGEKTQEALDLIEGQLHKVAMEMLHDVPATLLDAKKMGFLGAIIGEGEDAIDARYDAKENRLDGQRLIRIGDAEDVLHDMEEYAIESSWKGALRLYLGPILAVVKQRALIEKVAKVIWSRAKVGDPSGLAIVLDLVVLCGVIAAAVDLRGLFQHHADLVTHYTAQMRALALDQHNDHGRHVRRRRTRV